MSTLSVALLQIAAAGNDRAANLAKGEAACRRARAMAADIALFPEMWSVGYTPAALDPGGDSWRAPALWDPDEATHPEPDPAGVWSGLAIGRDDPFVERFRALARELELAIALTYLERWEGGPRNTVSVIDRRGEIVLTYAKVHTCAFCRTEAGLTPGDGFPVAELDTAHGPVQVGAMICYDREFPESARMLMLGGAEIILTPNACPLDAVRLAQFRVRAFENMVGVAMTNYPAPRQNGHSVAFDPIAYPVVDGPPRDTLIVEAGEQEGIFLAPFDLDRLRDYRRRETWGNAFRRPHRYGLLTSPAVAPPFVRVDRSGKAYDPTQR